MKIITLLGLFVASGLAEELLETQQPPTCNCSHLLNAEKEFQAYPTIPSTSFNCWNRYDGYYADVDVDCTIFHYCQTWHFPTGLNETVKWDFACPEGTIFNQKILSCTEPGVSFECKESPDYFWVNYVLTATPNPAAARPNCNHHYHQVQGIESQSAEFRPAPGSTSAKPSNNFENSVNNAPDFSSSTENSQSFSTLATSVGSTSSLPLSPDVSVQSSTSSLLNEDKAPDSVPTTSSSLVSEPNSFVPSDETESSSALPLSPDNIVQSSTPSLPHDQLTQNSDKTPDSFPNTEQPNISVSQVSESETKIPESVSSTEHPSTSFSQVSQADSFPYSNEAESSSGLPALSEVQSSTAPSPNEDKTPDSFPSTEQPVPSYTHVSQSENKVPESVSITEHPSTSFPQVSQAESFASSTEAESKPVLSDVQSSTTSPQNEDKTHASPSTEQSVPSYPHVSESENKVPESVSITEHPSTSFPQVSQADSFASSNEPESGPGLPVLSDVQSSTTSPQNEDKTLASPSTEQSVLSYSHVSQSEDKVPNSVPNTEQPSASFTQGSESDSFTSSAETENNSGLPFSSGVSVQSSTSSAPNEDKAPDSFPSSSPVADFISSLPFSPDISVQSSTVSSAQEQLIQNTDKVPDSYSSLLPTEIHPSSLPQESLAPTGFESIQSSEQPVNSFSTGHSFEVTNGPDFTKPSTDLETFAGSVEQFSTLASEKLTTVFPSNDFHSPQLNSDNELADSQLPNTVSENESSSISHNSESQVAEQNNFPKNETEKEESGSVPATENFTQQSEHLHFSTAAEDGSGSHQNEVSPDQASQDNVSDNPVDNTVQNTPTENTFHESEVAKSTLLHSIVFPPSTPTYSDYPNSYPQPTHGSGSDSIQFPSSNPFDPDSRKNEPESTSTYQNKVKSDFATSSQ